MPSQRITLGQWYDSTGANMTPNSAVVGGSGDVDDLISTDATYVTIRAEQINTLLGQQGSTFYWQPDAYPELPAFPADLNPRLDITVRHEMTVAPTEITTRIFRVQFSGALSSTISANGTATKDVRVTDSPLLFGNPPPFALTSDRWADIQNGDLELRIGFNTAGSMLNPITITPYPPGTEIRANIYQVILTVLWDSTGIPARRLWPRTDDLGIGIGRIYPPPNTPQSGARFGSSSPY